MQSKGAVLNGLESKCKEKPQLIRCSWLDGYGLLFLF